MGAPALYGRNHPRSIRWQVDYDYLRKLSPAEQQWLAQFTDEYHSGAVPASGGEILRARDEVRAAYRAKNAANRDVYTRIDENWQDVLAPGHPDEEYTPGYLDSQEYKAALAAVRALLSDNDRENPKYTEELAAAYERLERAK
jgi:hypothetical protein